MFMRRIGLVAARQGRLAPQARCITSETKEWATTLNKSLKETDPDLYKMIEDEKGRQRDSLVLIASENFTSR